MANKKVSQLSATTEANDNVWLIMNNSGNTETFRIKRSDLLSGATQEPGLVNGTGVDSLQNADYLTSIPADASGQQSISLGYDSTATQLFSTTIGAQSNSTAQSGIVVGAGSEATAQRAMTLGFLSKAKQIDAITIGAESDTNGVGAITIGKFRQTSGTGAINVGYGNRSVNGDYSLSLGGNNVGINTTGVGNTILNGKDLTLTGATDYTTLIGLTGTPTPLVSNTTYVDKLVGVGNSTQLNTGGGTNTQTAGSKNNFVVGSGNTIGGSNSFHVVFGEGNSNTNGNHPLGSFIFGRNCNANSTNNRWSMIVGNGCAVNATTGYVFGDNSNVNGDYGLSIGTNIVNAGTFSFAYGDGNRVITPYNLALGMDNDIESGSYNAEIGGQKHRNPSGSYNGYLSGYGNTGSTSNYGAFISGRENKITGTGEYNSIINGSGNTISSKTNAIMVGTNDETALYDNTTHVDNIHTFRTETFSTYSGGTVGGSIDIDVSQATMYKFSISANTTPNITNWKEGQRLVFVVVNLGTYTVPTMTITGGGSVLVKGGSINLTNNGITKYNGVIIDGDLYLNEELDFQAL